MEMVEYGYGAKAQTDPYSEQMASAGVQVVLLNRCTPSPLSPPIWPFANHTKNVDHFHFNLLKTSFVCLPLIRVFL